ncbi:MAG: type VI secretion system membrane subunit TssM [Ottowia sp.]|uniref:type VI secretion system membrane subunit TssM n=1 Tax=Ottowia sp. TaxID=1898956 RepID=UPI003C73E794
MKALFRFVFAPWLIIAVALVLLAFLIWWVGPLVHIGSLAPLEAAWVRASLIALILLLVLGRYAWRRWRARKASQRLTEGLVKPGEAKAAASTPGEQKILGDRFAEAIQTLKRMRIERTGKKTGLRDWFAISGGNYLYDLPWYVFIGAPGSGKTTALVNSGLTFPLAEKFGSGAIRGVGGTRNCDWWFTDEAVLIDTAGRYTTQDSNQAEDQSAWAGFLGLLKKSRPRRPLNGVLLTVSVADLMQPAQARAELCAAMRARLQELDQRLATRLPVYVMVTKTDLLSGFTEFFDDLGKTQREQVLGFTLPVDQSDHVAERGVSEFFTREFGLLHEQMGDRLIARMQAEQDPRRRASIFAFPAQFAALHGTLAETLDQVFLGSKFNQPPWIRGVYFTSGTQEGSPFDRVMGNLSRNFGLERAIVPPQKNAGRSYFLTNLLREVVFPEQGLAGADARQERRTKTWRLAALSAMSLATLALLAGWGYSTWLNSRYLDAVQAKVEPTKQALLSLSANSQTIAAVAPVLQGLRDIWKTPENNEGNPPLSMTLGLYQGDKMDSAAAAAHEHALSEVFLPQVSRRIEDQLRSANKDNLEFAYEALKSYLMLHQPEHFDSDALKAWITLDWNRNLDRGLSAQQIQALEQQLDALLAQGAPRANTPMDEGLVRSMRAMLASYPVEQRIFSRLKRQRLGRDIPAFSIAIAAGPSAPLVFERISGQPLTEGVPGLFTYDGYHKRFQQEVATVTPLLASEDPWVLGLERSALSAAKDAAGIGNLTDRVRRLYLEEYVKVWQQLLSDVRLIRASGVEKNIEIARILSGFDSPLAKFLKAAVRETTLTPSNDPAKANVVSKAAETVRSTRQGLEQLFGAENQRQVPAGKSIESIVDDHFEPLRRLVTAPAQGQPAPLDDALKLFNEVYVYLNAVDTAVKARSSPPPGDVAGKLRSDAGRLPEPVRSMIENLSQAGAAQARVAERSNLSQDLKPVADFCAKAIAGRYPFSPTSTRDVLPEDLGQMFAPGGLMDDFFQKRLAALVDTSSRPWRYKPVAEQGAITTAALAQFERAARIREIFFRSGGRTPSIRLDFKPVEMDASITQFILDVDGQVVRYGHGPIVPMTIQWPGPKGSNQVRIQLNPPSPAGGASGMTTDGAWALFRVLDRSQLESGDAPEKFFVTFSVDGRKARFEVTTNSVQHPLRLREMREFSCPAGL